MTSPVLHKIFFVRHGQCRGNVTGESLLPEEDVITDFGRKQASALGEHLKHIDFSKAYSSNYERAAETAKEILKMNESSSVTLEQDPRIREREMGDLVGLHAREIIGLTLEQLANGKKFNEIEIPGAESIAEYEERQRSFFKGVFEQLQQSKASENVLVVSHGLAMRRFLVGLNDGTFSDICSTTNWTKKCGSVIENTACTVFTVDFSTGGKPLITFEKVHDKEHLEKLKGCETSEGGETGINNNSTDAMKSTFNVSKEEKMKFIQKALEIPNAKEELSGCVQM